MRYVQLVIGPAGTGKSTYCHRLQDHGDVSGRPVSVVNLDPAAEAFQYRLDADVRDLVSLDDVCGDESLGLGPNGGLVHCMEYLEDNLEEARSGLDGEGRAGASLWCSAPGDRNPNSNPCPHHSGSVRSWPLTPTKTTSSSTAPGRRGLFLYFPLFFWSSLFLSFSPSSPPPLPQIELYSSSTVFRTLIEWLRAGDWQVCVVYLLDATSCAAGGSRFVAGALQALAAMVLLEAPHVSVLTKLDLCDRRAREAVERMLVPDGEGLRMELAQDPRSGGSKEGGGTGPSADAWGALNSALAGVLDEWALVSFVTLDIGDEDSVARVMGTVDQVLQFGEDAEPKTGDAADEPWGGREGGDDCGYRAEWGQAGGLG